MSRSPLLAVDLRALVATPSGIGVYTRSLLLELARRGEFRLLGLAHRAPHGEAELRAAGIEIETAAAPLGVLWQQLALPRRLARGDVDLFWSPILTLPRRCPVPAVVSIHDLTILLYPETQNAKVRWSLRPFLERSVETAVRVVALTEAGGREIARHLPAAAGKIDIVPNGVDPEFSPGEPESLRSTRARLATPRGYVLYAGTLEPRKNLETLLDAWEIWRGERPHGPDLLLVGPDGWGSGELKRRIAGLAGAGVRWLGRLPRAEQVEAVRAAAAFVFPSHYEGFGLPPLEAMACGIPTVVSDTPALAEVVADAALVVPVDDPGELAHALERLVAEPGLGERLALAGPARAAGFTWSLAAERLSRVFAAALASRPARSRR